MSRTRRYLIAGAAVLAVSAGGVGIALAGGDSDDDGDAQVSGAAAAKATDAALEVTGGGTANSVERDSENGATWEVEVTAPDGKTVDVRLDESYDLVVVEGDDEGARADD